MIPQRQYRNQTKNSQINLLTARTYQKRKQLQSNPKKTIKPVKISLQLKDSDFPYLSHNKQNNKTLKPTKINIDYNKQQNQCISTPQKTVRKCSRGQKQDNPSVYEPMREHRFREWSIDDFNIVKTMGKGKFGTVYAAEQKKSGYVVAIKKMNRLELKNHNFQSQVQREIEIQAGLKHPNILKLYGYFWDDSFIYLILEYAHGGELLNFLKFNGSFTEQQVSIIIREVCLGLQYLHKNKVIHRDIKPENIMVSCDGIKLADFGWSVKSEKRRETLCGTLDYLAPQIVKGGSHNHTIDIWQIGILTYELVVGHPPFQTLSFSETYSRILKDEVSFPFDVSIELQDFIKVVLQKDSEKRPQLSQVLRHKFIERYKNESDKMAVQRV